MCRSNCPFAAALFGAIAGSAAGAALGAASGWLLYAAYAGIDTRDASGLALLLCGTLGMAIGGSAGSVGGMIEGWANVQAHGSARGAAARWGATLAGLWALQPILWLAISSDRATALTSGLGIAASALIVGAFAGLLGGVAARAVVRAFGLGGPAALAVDKRCG